jgi:hypothetical protein
MAHMHGRVLVLIASSMLMLMVSAAPACAQSNEKKIPIEQAPAKVRAAILKAVGDGRLVDIGEFTDGDTKTYEIEMVVNGEEWDVLFDADGKVLRKSFQGQKAEKPANAEDEESEESEGFQSWFDLEHRRFATTGRNRYFILEPGYQLLLEGPEGKHTVALTVTVLNETKRIGDIETRVVEERESVDGQLIEVSRNFFAICTQTKSIFYFGEEVDEYKDGKIVAHHGEWLHGENGARAGMMMPGDPILGASYYQEYAPGAAMDRGTVAAVDVTLKTPAGVFENCLKIREENPLDKEREFKIHAPGIGLIQDEDLLLVKYGFVVGTR